MRVKELLKGFRSELDNVIAENFRDTNTIITVENLPEYEQYLDSIHFMSKHGKTILFTNGNSWYIPTLIKNLLESMKVNETLKVPMGVICTDLDGYNTCEKYDIKHAFLAKIPLLKVDDLLKVNKPEDYTRLVFIKMVLAYHALKLGYTVLYIDPDMAFVKPSLQYIIDMLDDYETILAGLPEGNMNTNILGMLPRKINIKLTEIDVHTFEANILNRTKYGRFMGGDEEIMIMKDQYHTARNYYLDIDRFPPGNYIDGSKNLMMLHANGISGLENKINFMKKYNGWFLKK